MLPIVASLLVLLVALLGLIVLVVLVTWVACDTVDWHHERRDRAEGKRVGRIPSAHL